jgi:hypothetical protein
MVKHRYNVPGGSVVWCVTDSALFTLNSVAVALFLRTAVAEAQYGITAVVALAWGLTCNALASKHAQQRQFLATCLLSQPCSVSLTVALCFVDILLHTAVAEAKDGSPVVVALAWGLTRDALASNMHSSGGSLLLAFVFACALSICVF